ncbi:MAG: ATP-binding cassette domain-containing protein [Oscillospiraceae bacterium]|nr:ribose ABC transporter (ATP-binding protein) [Ruminococcaceae bacterium BL-4]
MEPIVQMKNITKRFPGVVALNKINFDVCPGEVHVLLGENGAGKSTLMKVLSGAYKPDEGSIVLNGKEYDRLTPHLSSEGGISIIYQELSVVNWLDIRENIFMGRLPMKKVGPVSVVDYAAMNAKTKELLKKVNLSHCTPTTNVGDLSISEKQMVEIAKSIAFNAKVIVMDEPTSSLTEDEVQKLFTIIRQLKAEGRGVVFISHKLSEISEIGDRITILKDGGYVGTYNVSDLTTDDMIRMMVGREIKGTYQHLPEEHYQFGDVMFSCKNLTRKDHLVENISFDLRKGEILGFSGLVGAGRSETMCAVYGAAPKISGDIFLNGKKLKIRNPYDALQNGIGMVTENRRETGFFQNFSNQRNISIARQLKESKLDGLIGLTNESEEKKMADEQHEAIQIKWTSREQLTSQLSGGNQQKVILGKWMAANVKVLIFDEPTKGIDVGTKSEIYKLMRRLADNGIGVIVVSSEMPELLGLCDRIIIMANGRITGSYDIAEATEEKLAKAATSEMA